MRLTLSPIKFEISSRGGPGDKTLQLLIEKVLYEEFVICRVAPL